MNGYTYISVPGQSTINLNSTSNTLNLTSSAGITITTIPGTNTLTINTNSSFTVADLVVTNSLTLNPTNVGSLDNVAIGQTTPRQGTFTTLTATGLVSFNPNNANVTISPTGSGTVTINPATTGSIDNCTIGANTANTGRFTNVTITSFQQTNSSSAITKGYAAALSAAYGVALS